MDNPLLTEQHPELPDVMTVEEVAAWLRLNKKTIYDAVKAGELPCCKVGRILRFSRESVLRCLNGQGRVSQPQRRKP